MFSFSLTEEAKEDLFRIYNFGVFRFGEMQAIEYLDKLYDCFDKIKYNPFLFPEAINYRDVDRF